ncbi:MAG: hypothetical protein JW734_05090 [Candidatus Omnitrophica bacterium]|nr:hypothetical protein [Candidatus Omnitrophota bacterium]
MVIFSWRRVLPVCSVILFLAVVILGYALIQTQETLILSLRTEVRGLQNNQVVAQKTLIVAEKQITDLGLRCGSLEEGLRNNVDTFNSRLSLFDNRMDVQEKTTRQISSKIEEVSSRLLSLAGKETTEDTQSQARAQVNLGNISVDSK